MTPEQLQKYRERVNRWIDSAEEYPYTPSHVEGYDLVALNHKLMDEIVRLHSQIEAQKKVIDAVRNWRLGLIDKVYGRDIGTLAGVYPAVYKLAGDFDEYEGAKEMGVR